MTPLPSSDLKQAAGADVLLLFLESYGATSYDRPELARALLPARAGLENAAAETGRRVVSAFVESPTFGGQSVLAHSTLMSGVEVRETGDYNLLLTQQRETLPSRFKAAGYRSVAVMPGVRSAWPEGGFYNFDIVYGEQDLDYRGPEFGWWRIPDQYTLAKFDALELHGAARVPRFLFFPTINTHIPFRPTPPYQADWQRVLGTDPFDAAAAKASQAQQPDWTHLGVAYTDSFAYTFKYLADYLRSRRDADFVIVMLGDHQPAATVTGPGARWDVPVHVVTSRPAIADALVRAGFVEGVDLAPNRAPLAKMAGLTTILLRAFDGSAARLPVDGSHPDAD